MLAVRASFELPLRAVAAATLAARAADIAAIEEGGIVSGFWPIGAEIDIRPLMAALHGLGVPLALPVTVPKVKAGGGPSLLFRRWRPEDGLVPAAFGLREPAASAETVTPRLMLVPLLAFDRAGGRLGYGKGHYDSAITALSAAGPLIALGVAFAAQEVPAVPMEPHDRRLDGVLTENGLVDCRPPRD